jgi:enediyne biosynthesis protein E4
MSKSAPQVSLLLLASCLVSVPSPASAADLLTDVSAASRLKFRYDNGMSGKMYFPEIMGAGVGVLDYDNDGKLDIYLVQGGALGPDIGPAHRKSRDRLFRNLSAEGTVRFEDVTAKSGIDARGYGMGVAVADIDSDGDEDLYLLNFGPNQLWRNNGDGSFTDITAKAGVGDPRWSVSASFADIDGDGKLDLYVANYVDFSFATHKDCKSMGGGEVDYCSPSAYPPVADRLYRNLGDGRFEDISERSGIAAAKGPGLGVVAADFNRDGRIDWYVANDGTPNFLWLNQSDGSFVDDAVLAGAAVNADGAAEAGMGVAVADFDRSGEVDLFITHMRNESNTLYAGVGEGWFEDRSARSGLAASSMAYTGFGTGWFDLDLDGWLDLHVANGAVVRELEPPKAELAYPYAQTDQLYLHNGKPGREAAYVEASARGGAAMQVRGITRGAAFADLDNDGRTDIILSSINGPARILSSVAPESHHWIGLDLYDSSGKVRVSPLELRRIISADAGIIGQARRDGSYASANDPRAVFGLGSSEQAQIIEVQWPNGKIERYKDLAVDRYHRLQQGQGEAFNEPTP